MQKRIVKILHHKVDELCQKKNNVKVPYGGLIVLKWYLNQKVIEYGSLYVTLCFVLWRFDFGVLTFYFRILSFLLCVLCTMLFILIGAMHEVETRYRQKDGRKTKL